MRGSCGAAGAARGERGTRGVRALLGGGLELGGSLGEGIERGIHADEGELALPALSR
jgi:hypothetical protein